MFKPTLSESSEVTPLQTRRFYDRVNFVDALTRYNGSIWSLSKLTPFVVLTWLINA